MDSETGRIVTAADQIFPKAGMVAISEDVVEVKSKLGAAVRSAVFPGGVRCIRATSAEARRIRQRLSALLLERLPRRSCVQAEDKYNENTPDTVDEREAANGHYDRVNYFLIGLGALWAVAVSDAYITGVDAMTINVDAVGEETSGMVTVGGSF